MHMVGNPYQAPAVSVFDFDALATENERIRSEHIGHERQLRAVGWLFLFGGALGLLGGIVLFAGLSRAQFVAGEGMMLAALFVVTSIGALVVGRGCRKLAPWVRIPGTALAAIGLLGVPVGTIISLAILWLIWSARGKRVLSPDYATIIATTPHVRHRITLIDWIAWGLLAVALTWGLFALASIALALMLVLAL
jgi:hypothetical protein